MSTDKYAASPLKCRSGLRIRYAFTRHWGWALDGLTNDEKRTAVTLWAMANAPMYLGGDLTKIDSFGKSLVSNDEVIAVNQSGKPAKQVLGGYQQVWVSDLGNHNYYVALVNLNATPATVQLPWNLLGATGASQVRDLWAHDNLGLSVLNYSTVLKGHSARLLKVTTFGQAPPSPTTSYEAESAVLGGSAAIADCSPCSGGEKVGDLGLGANNTVTFTNVYVRKAGTYLMQVDSMAQGLRSYLYSINNGAFQTLNSGGGSFQNPCGHNCSRAITKRHEHDPVLWNPTSYPPDLDRIVIRGNEMHRFRQHERMRPRQQR